jgi:hypothetical protein
MHPSDFFCQCCEKNQDGKIGIFLPIYPSDFFQSIGKKIGRIQKIGWLQKNRTDTKKSDDTKKIGRMQNN